MLRKLIKFISLLLCFLLCFEQSGFAQVAGQLDISGHLAALRNSFAPDVFRPLHLRYLSYNPQENNFQLFLDKGSLKNPNAQEVEDTTKTLLNYFFVGISLPNDKFWVNLRPDAEDNIIDNQLAQTDVGKILLESDLQLKKDTARFTSPEISEGKEYWDKLYKKAGEIFGSQNVTIPTLTRPWIVPDEIIIRETPDSAYIYKATLKVMLEQDYLKDSAVYNFKDDRLKELNEYSSQLIRELIIPKLTKEINTSKRYASLRQVYYSLILASWFKARNQDKTTSYSRLIDRGDLTNLTSKEPWSKGTYFKAYKENFEKGEYNLQEPVYTLYGQTVRSYFSGGISGIAPSISSFGAVNSIDPKTGARITSLPASTGISKILTKGRNLLAILLVAGGIAINSANSAEVRIINPETSQTLQTAPEIVATAEQRLAKIMENLGIDVEADRNDIQRLISSNPKIKDPAFINFCEEAVSVLFKDDLYLKAQSVFSKSNFIGDVLNLYELLPTTEKQELTNRITAGQFRHTLLYFKTKLSGALKANIIFPLIEISKDFDQNKWDGLLESLKNNSILITQEDLQLLNAIIHYSELKNRLFDNAGRVNRAKLLEEAREIYTRKAFPRKDLPMESLKDLESKKRHLERELELSKDALETRKIELDLKMVQAVIKNYSKELEMVTNLYAGRPSLESLSTLKLFKIILLDRSLRDSGVQEELSQIVSEGINAQGEAGGVFILQNGLLHPSKKMSTSKRSETYFFPDYYEAATGGLFAFHTHTPYGIDASDYTGPSGFPGNIQSDFISHEYIGADGVVITPMGLAQDSNKLRVNIDIFWSAGDGEGYIVDLGEFLLDYSPSSGQMKRLGPRDPFDEDGEPDSLRGRHTEFEDLVSSVSVQDVYGLTARVVQADLGRAGAYHFYSPTFGLIIVVSSRYDNQIQEEGKFHEVREIYWMGKGLNQYEAHIIASAEQVQRFSRDGGLTSYHSTQLREMTEEEREAIRGESEEMRQWHHSVLERANTLGAGIDIDRIRHYEENLRSVAGKQQDEMGGTLNNPNVSIDGQEGMGQLFSGERAGERRFLYSNLRPILRLKDEQVAYYPAAGYDIAGILAGIDAHQYLLVDAMSKNIDQLARELINQLINDILGLDRESIRCTKIKEDNRIILRFMLWGRERVVVYYFNRAAERFTPEKYPDYKIDVVAPKLGSGAIPIDIFYYYGYSPIFTLNLPFELLTQKGVIVTSEGNPYLLSKYYCKVIKDYSGLSRPLYDKVYLFSKSVDSTDSSTSLESIPRGTSAPGGIDFRALPIVTQATSNLKAGIIRASLSQLKNINLMQEQQEIQRMLEAGITPSTERIKEYIQASCAKDEIEAEVDKIVSCIADILRSEEERCCETESTLRDLLVVLESASSSQQLKEVFIGNAS